MRHPPSSSPSFHRLLAIASLLALPTSGCSTSRAVASKGELACEGFLNRATRIRLQDQPF